MVELQEFWLSGDPNRDFPTKLRSKMRCTCNPRSPKSLGCHLISEHSIQGATISLSCQIGRNHQEIEGVTSYQSWLDLCSGDLIVLCLSLTVSLALLLSFNYLNIVPSVV